MSETGAEEKLKVSELLLLTGGVRCHAPLNVQIDPSLHYLLVNTLSREVA